MDNINTWTGPPVEKSIRMTEINGESTSMVWPTLGSKTAKEQNKKASAIPEMCLQASILKIGHVTLKTQL